jgi:F-type H+-transporting ATPase subunit c
MSPTLAKTLRVALALILGFGALALPAPAQEPAPTSQPETAAQPGTAATEAPASRHDTNLWRPLVALGAGLVVVGGAMGIGRLASSAMEGTARQPEAGGAIRTSMIIAAALIEGFTLFALIVCIIATK